MSTIDDIFSEENMLKYADACIDLAVDVPQFRSNSQEPFDTLVIPSRGAVPFFLGMVYALGQLRDIGPEYHDFIENVGVQEMLAPLIPESSPISRTVDGKKVRVLLSPFTADLNIEKYDKRELSTEYTKKTREYWARVTASFFKPLEERTKDPYFRSFTEVILKEIERRGYVAENYARFPQITNFAMIDTIISGRAATEILQAFDAIARETENDSFNPHSFLVIDESGRKLRPVFSRYLNIKRARGQIREMYEVPRIVSEDEGASLLGVSAVVYPSVMKESKLLSIGGKEFFVGAGSWRLGSDLGEGENMYKLNFDKFMGLVYAAIDTQFASQYGLGEPKFNLDRFRHIRKEVAKYLADKKVLTINDPNTEVLNLNPRYTVVEPYETGSHVVHIPFDASSTEQLLSRICSSPGVFCHRPLAERKR